MRNIRKGNENWGRRGRLKRMNDRDGRGMRLENGYPS
jgi:hypothetical protein